MSFKISKKKSRFAVALASVLILVSVLPALSMGTPDAQNNGLVVTDVTDPGLNAEDVADGLFGSRDQPGAGQCDRHG